MRKLFHKKGFTLIELLVVIVIMSLITLAFVENQSKFDSSTIVRSLAYSIALSIRQTQVYGTSVVQNSPGSSLFGPVYGVSFGSSPLSSATSYSIFSDSTTPSTGEFDAGMLKMKTFSINNEYAIQEVCAVTNTNTWRCNGTDDASNTGSISTLDIMFLRPNPDARINVFHSDHSTITGDTYTTAYIQLKAINSDVRVIKVMLTGQVSVCQGVGNLNVAAGAGNYTLASVKANSVSC